MMFVKKLLSYFGTMWKYLFISLFAAVFVLWSCRDEVPSDDIPVPEDTVSKPYLVSAALVYELSYESIKAVASVLGQSELTSRILYGVKTYKLVYETSYRGEIIRASGLLYLPVGLADEAPLLSLHHGTTFEKAEAPSVSGEFTGMELFASSGYITLMPDFIGYGESAEIFHPYYDKEHSATAVIDMIKSAKEFLTSEGIGFNKKLFLAGYSEGGYVTLAAAKEIESDASHNLTVTAMAAGAGGYDLTGMLQGVIDSKEYSYPSYLAFVLMSYNITYEWNKPLNFFFRERYAEALSQYMNGLHGGSFINSKLTTVTADLFNPDFYARLKDTKGETELKSALAANSVSGWKTNLPTRLYHGINDEVIPYQNSETTLNNFKEAGSPQVTLELIPGGTHGSSFVPMLQSFVPWFETLKK